LAYGLEAIMLSAGANVEWLCDLGLLRAAADSHEVAASVESTGGVTFVPALVGLGTPYWDFGARGTLLGVTRGTSAAHVVRAVLEGIAQRGVDLLDAALADAGIGSVPALRVDGGMSANPTFVQLLADLAAVPIDVSPTTDATIRGAAFLAGLAVGVWDDIADAAELWAPSRTVAPVTDRSADRSRWARSIGRSRAWIPELSALDF
jgi:glycerol kinase